jgi:hypothetical protein
MAVDLDRRLESVQRSYFVGVLEQIRGIVDDPTLVQRDITDLKNALRQVIDIITAPDLLALTRDRLTEITGDAPYDTIAVANPSVRLLKRGPENDFRDRGQVFELLSGTAAAMDYSFGYLVLQLNPYFLPREDLLSDDQYFEAVDNPAHGGPLRDFDAFSRWQPGNPTFPHIPHPDEPHPGIPDYEPSWYMVTHRTPKSLPDPITGLPADQLLRARNVVKTVEVAYGEPIDTGELLPGGAHKTKQAHVFIMYAGGNGT